MEIYHTSPNKIETITTDGFFNDCLFFALEPYFMTQSPNPVTYKMEIDETTIISCKELYDEAIIESIISDVQDQLDITIDKDDAEKILDSRKNILDFAPEDTWDFSDFSEYEWEVQRLQAECATKMGYNGVEAIDEQGCVYIIPMLNKENELILVNN